MARRAGDRDIGHTRRIRAFKVHEPSLYQRGGPRGAVIVPDRAPLPPGVSNYVTPRGLAALREERAALDAERSRLAADTDADGRQRDMQAIAKRLTALGERIASAQLVEPNARPTEVRFGTTVTVQTIADGAPDGPPKTFTIVGVDEAEAREARVAFTAPIARAVTGLGAGESAPLQTPSGPKALRVESIEGAG